jgi:hypothetical protein
MREKFTMKSLTILGVLILAILNVAEASFQIGLGRFDVTGPSTEVPFVIHSSVSKTF